MFMCRNLLMASCHRLFVALFIFAAILEVASYAEGEVLFSKLPNTLLVTAALPGGGPFPDRGLQTTEDSIVVTWKVNTTAAPVTATKVQTKLCFAEESQVERVWRKTYDDLSRDKSCLFEISVAVFSTAGASVNYLLADNVPRGKYFVRAYALDANGYPVAYGQSSPDKIANVFSVIPISGRSSAMNVAAAILSVLSVSCLFGFFILEHMLLKRKKSV
ncbi:hypothetical protein M758_8G090600 [Ceratodon purpureus]|nr:hypothetical protein M758_8G090600 [Ceratodon purpureus]